jgi:hypothetical protein
MSRKCLICGCIHPKNVGFARFKKKYGWKDSRRMQIYVGAAGMLLHSSFANNFGIQLSPPIGARGFQPMKSEIQHFHFVTPSVGAPSL